MKIKIGDEVMVRSGKDKGKKGKVDRVLPKTASVLVSGVNMYKKNLKGNNQVKQSGIVDIVKPLRVSSVSLVCPKCNLPTRISYVLKNKEKNRVCKKCGQIVD